MRNCTIKLVILVLLFHSIVGCIDPKLSRVSGGYAGRVEVGKFRYSRPTSKDVAVYRTSMYEQPGGFLLDHFSLDVIIRWAAYHITPKIVRAYDSWPSIYLRTLPFLDLWHLNQVWTRKKGELQPYGNVECRGSSDVFGLLVDDSSGFFSAIL